LPPAEATHQTICNTIYARAMLTAPDETKNARRKPAVYPGR